MLLAASCLAAAARPPPTSRPAPVRCRSRPSTPFSAPERIRNNWTGGQSRQVVHNQAEWNQLFQTVTGDSPAPAIDFTGQHVFFATTGVKIVTGHDIVIDEIWKDEAAGSTSWSAR